MKITGFEKSQQDGSVRLSACIQAGDLPQAIQQRMPERLWIDWPEDYTPHLELRADPFVIMLLPLAGVLRDGIECEQPISEKLYHNLLEASGVYQSYWPGQFYDVSFSLKTESRRRTSDGLQASFYSGGVDSLYNIAETERRHRAGLGRRVEHLWFVQGLDIWLDDEEFWNETVKARALATPDGSAQSVYLVRTNVRSFYDGIVTWHALGCGPALGGIAKCASGSVDRVLIGSGITYERMVPHSTTPLVDPLWSCDEQDVVNFSSRVGRYEKLRTIGEVTPEYLKNLRVCWENLQERAATRGGKYNCGVCEKCVRTRLFLRVLGLEDRVETFEGRLEPEMLAAIRLSSDSSHLYVFDFWREMLDACRPDAADADFAAAIRHAMRESRAQSVRVKRKLVNRH